MKTTNDFYARIREITFMESLSDMEKDVLISGLISRKGNSVEHSAEVDLPVKSANKVEKPELSNVEKIYGKKHVEQPEDIMSLFGKGKQHKTVEKPTAKTEKPVVKGEGIVQTFREIVLSFRNKKFTADKICELMKEKTGEEHRATVQTQLSRVNRTHPDDFNIERMGKKDGVIIYKNNL